MNTDKNTPLTEPLFCYLIAIYITFLVTAFATASKLVALPFGLSASVSTVTSYAFCFIITDIISEIYGYKASRLAVRLGFICLSLALIIFYVAVSMTPAVGFTTQEGFEQTLNYPIRIIIGGLAGYYLSQQTDIFIYHHLKKLTKGKHLWLRNNASTVIAQLVDSIVWISIAFIGTVPNIVALITGEYLVKLVVAVLDTAILYLIVSRISKKLKSNGAGGGT